MIARRQACELIKLVSSSKVPETSIQVFEGSALVHTELATFRVPHGADSLDERVSRALSCGIIPQAAKVVQAKGVGGINPCPLVWTWERGFAQVQDPLSWEC